MSLLTLFSCNAIRQADQTAGRVTHANDDVQYKAIGYNKPAVKLLKERHARNETDKQERCLLIPGTKRIKINFDLPVFFAGKLCFGFHFR